jgi:phage tail sheath protein FI
LAEYLSPGVYVEEYDSSPRTIEGAGTSTAGFVGLAEKGPSSGAPVYITSFVDFTRTFGGYLSAYAFGEYRFLAYSVEQFFVNGGARCFVSRVVPSDAKSAEVKVGDLTVAAANEGKWGNHVTVSFVATANTKLQLVAQADGERAYIAKQVGALKAGDIVEFEGELNRVETVRDNVITFVNAFSADPVDASPVAKKFVYSQEMDVIVRADGAAEVFSGVNLYPESASCITKKLSTSEIIKVTGELGAPELAKPVAALTGEDKESVLYALEGGSDGTMDAVNAGTFLGVDNGPGKRSGIEAFKENSIVSLMLVPGVAIPEVTVGLVAHCENEKFRFAILDFAQEKTKIDELTDYRSLVDSSFCAFYHPWVQVYDRSTGKPGFIPPSGAVAGVYARSDSERGVHKAPANETVACTGLSVNYTTKEQDMLNPQGVNLIRALPGQGIRVWGARTASSDTNFKYVNVRRLFIFIENSIKNATNWVVFEPNNAELWGRVGLTVTSFLETCFQAGMFAGAGTSDSFFVDIGPSTMTRDDISSGRLICNIGIAPVRPAEFVIFRVTQFTAEAGGGA